MVSIGQIVQYRQKRGMQGWLPAIVTVTPETYVSGRWMTLDELQEEAPHLQGGMVIQKDAADGDGQHWIASSMPPVKKDRVHLQVFSPGNGQSYDPHAIKLTVPMNFVEFNVPEGEDPGCWRVGPLGKILG